MTDSVTHESTKTTILDTIGQTPLIPLRQMGHSHHAKLWVKLESHNPMGSIKDRVALAMIEQAEQDGVLKPGYTIVEPSSGNTAIALAMVAAVKGYNLIITMPTLAHNEYKRILEHFGARVIETPARKQMQGAIDKARSIVQNQPRCYMPQQFHNVANPAVHQYQTAQEIIQALPGTLDTFIAGVGTGGTLSGMIQACHTQQLTTHIVAVEPERSQVLQGYKSQPHGLQGIGAGFIPPHIDLDRVDQVMACSEENALQTAQQLARKEGILAGPSSGANVWVALQIAKQRPADHNIVTLICDGWERSSRMCSHHSVVPGIDFII